MGSFFLAVTLVSTTMVMAQYNKLFKSLDLLMAVLLLANINQYALLAMLGIKIVIMYAFAPKILAA